MALAKSQRIALIREISARLGPEDWPLIDLTLQQFELPSTDDWRGQSREVYVVEMIKQAGDDILIDLARHLGFDPLTGERSKIEPEFWRKGMFRLFVSHLAVHRETAARLQEALLCYGISCFVAHNDIAPTLEWQIQIETALSTCDALVALLHPDFHASSWTDQEIGFAMGRGLPVFAVRLGHDPYGFIARFQAFNGGGKDESVLAKELFDAYRKNKQTETRMSAAVVHLFEESSNFAIAKERVSYLEALNYWDAEFSGRIETALKQNGQLAGSWGVPERVARLLKKWAHNINR